MDIAERIVLSSWFLPGYVGLIIGMGLGIATCFIAENWVQSGVAAMRARRDRPSHPTPSRQESKGGERA